VWDLLKDAGMGWSNHKAARLGAALAYYSVFSVGPLVLIAVAVVAVAGFSVYRLHGIFGSHNKTSTASAFSNEIVPFNPKHVVLEVFGAPGTVATINYLDVNAAPQRVDDATLPWSYDTNTTEPAVSLNVVA